MLRPIIIHLSQDSRLQNLAVHNGLARTMARRFVAGETLPEAVDAVRLLNARGMTATLDHLGENVTSAEEAQGAADAYCRILRELGRAGLACNVSLKLTHMGLDLGEECALENTGRVVSEAAELNNFVCVDMESSAYTERTLRVFYRLFDQYKNVGTVLQSYLYRSREDLERLIEAGARVRLVKGAYLEPPEVAYQEKSDVEDNFIRLMEILLSRGNSPAIATHDPRMIGATKEYARREGIDRARYEFQMLYGIRRDLQTQLLRDGYNMRVYVPYGTQWYPYLMRRMAERPANLMVLVGNVVREALPGGR